MPHVKFVVCHVSI